MTTPKLIISLDFELHWGRFDKYDLQTYLPYYAQTRKSISEILRLFEAYQIHATWATVGSLMARDLDEWDYYKPDMEPTYFNEKFSAYEWIKKQKNPAPEALFAPQLVQAILATPFQEIGSHTFAHFYTCEPGQREIQFRADLIAAKKIAQNKFGIDLKSLVYPRNQYSEEILEISRAQGFKVVRTNPGDWYWKSPHKENFLKKLMRTGDTLLPLGKRSSYPMSQSINGMLALPASRLLRPFKKGSVFNERRIERICQEMTQAAKVGECYHLWWHPHNFGSHPKENFYGLELVLKHYRLLADSYGMESRSMGGLGVFSTEY